MSTEAYRSAWSSYQEAISSLYDQSIESLIATPERTDVKVPEEEVLERALESSEALAQAAGARLEAEDPEDSQLATMQLAAGASVDLGVAADLARHDEDFQFEALPLKEEETLETLSYVIEEAAPVLSAQSLTGIEEESGEGRKDGGIPNAEAVANAVETALAQIGDDAADSSKDIVKGMTLIGASAAKLLEGIAQQLIGLIGEGLGRIIRKVVQFVIKGIEKLLRLLGPELGDAIVEKLKGWLKDRDLADAAFTFVWESRKIEEVAKQEARKAGDRLDDDTRDRVVDQLEALSARFGKQSKLLRNIVKVVNFLAGKLVALPNGALFVEAAYGSSLAFVVVSGGDYVDWYRLGDNKLFDRVEGVRRIVNTATSTGDGADA